MISAIHLTNIPNSETNSMVQGTSWQVDSWLAVREILLIYETQKFIAGSSGLGGGWSWW
jgi:hypothetical protein